MVGASIVFLYILLTLVLAGIVTLLVLWQREGGIFPGEKYERTTRDLLDEIDTKLTRFEKEVREAAKLKREIQGLLSSLHDVGRMHESTMQSIRELNTRADSLLVDNGNLNLLPEEIPVSPAQKTTAAETESADVAAGMPTEKAGIAIPELVAFEPAETSDTSGVETQTNGKKPRELDEKSREILRLAESGVGSAEIAQKLGMWRGEVDLVIALNRRTAD